MMVSALLMSANMMVNTAYAAGETLTITPSATEVIVNQEVTVTLTLNYPVGLSAAMFELVYDASLFTYVSGDAGGGSYSGVIPINYTEMAVPTSLTWTLKFKAVKTGTSSFTIADGGTFISKDIEAITPAITNTSVKVWAQGSDDATLSTLQVAGFSLNPAFGKWTTDYIVYVDSNTTSVSLVAQATQAAQGGRVEISGNTTNLNFGNNYVTIKSYAPNGKVITYNMNIYRLDPPTEPPTTEPPTEPPKWSEVVVDGKTYNISADFTLDMIPNGFVSTVYDYKGNEALAVLNNKLRLDLLYLMDEEHNGTFFIYDKSKDEFYPYIVINSVNNSYVVLPNGFAEDTPSDSKEGTFVIGEQEIKGLNSNSDKSFSYFYAVNQNGEYGWYSYDALEGTIQRFHSIGTAPSGDDEKETSSVENSWDSTDGNNDFSSEKESLLAENGSLIKIRNIVFIIAAGLLLIVVALVIILIAGKGNNKQSAPNADKTVANKVDSDAKADDELTEEVDTEEVEDDMEADIDIASVYDEAIMGQMAATTEDINIADNDSDDIAVDTDINDDDVTEDDDTVKPEIISLDDEELL